MSDVAGTGPGAGAVLAQSAVPAVRAGSAELAVGGGSAEGAVPVGSVGAPQGRRVAKESVLEIGTQLPPRSFRVTRADLIRYAGASGDFNPIHWSDRVAAQVGLPGVIAHGMFTMALVGRAVTDWVGDPTAVLDYGVRFTRPVPVPDTDEGAELIVSAQVKAAGEPGLVVLDLTAVCGGEKVLAQARATVRVA